MKLKLLLEEKRHKAACIPYFIDTKESLFMKPSNASYGGDKFQISKGRIEKNENSKDAALREAKEELGLKYSNIKNVSKFKDFELTGLDESYILEVFIVEVKNRVIDFPCIDYFIKRCGGPCIGAISPIEYKKIVQQVMDFLSGKSDELEKSLKVQMMEAAQAKLFEKAARIRAYVGKTSQGQLRRGEKASRDGGIAENRVAKAHRPARRGRKGAGAPPHRGNPHRCGPRRRTRR